MLDHTGIVVSDLKAARRFYDAVAGALGLQTKTMHPAFFLLGKSENDAIPYLWIGTLIPTYWAEGSRAGLNQMHVAFQADSKAMVKAFHAAALEAGGRDNGPPGPRQDFGYYGAFVLDPDGNNIEAVYRGPGAETP